MAKPRIFVSSTYYDLKYIRADIERFVTEQGFEAVLNEKGHIPYGSAEKLEEYCYKEIDLCDILISIIGGRFGSESKEQDYSISNLELKTAIEKGKQVYIFVEQAVYSEFRTYEANKDLGSVTYTAVDDKRIYKFIEEVYALPLNNQVKSFVSVHEITVYLKEQWAGLFQRLLSESARQKEVNLIEDLKNTSKTLNQLVAYLIDEKSKGDQAIKDILLSNHPAFDEIRRKLEIPYRIIFQNKEELSQLLNARQMEELDELLDTGTIDGFFSWKKRKADYFLRVSKEIFDEDNKLKIFTPNEWDQNWIKVEDLDDIPF
jgi:hypothetical protein